MIYDIFPQNSYSGNGQSTNFDFDFYIENPNQLNVFYYNSDGAKTKLVYNVDYSIAEFKKQDGSYITFPIAGSNYSVLSENERIVLELTLPISQEIEYNNSSSLNADTLEYSFDYLTRLVQILSKRIDYCIETSDYTSQDLSGLVQNIINCASKAQEAYDGILEYGMTPATTTEKGVVRIGNGIEVDNDGTISVDSLPNQTDNEGKFLTTDGTNASWTDSIATDLNGKADVDLGNINASQSAKDEIVSWGIPDWTTSVQIPTTLNLVQQADEDVVLHGGVTGGYFRMAICTSTGTEITQLFSIANGNTTYPIYNWSPIVKKGQYFKVTSVGASVAILKLYLSK